MPPTQEAPVEQYLDLRREDFRAKVTRKWNAAEQVLNLITEHVENGDISPIEGVSAFGCTVATFFGYRELHGGVMNTTPADLLAAVKPMIG